MPPLSFEENIYIYIYTSWGKNISYTHLLKSPEFFFTYTHFLSIPPRARPRAQDTQIFMPLFKIVGSATGLYIHTVPHHPVSL